jgi:transcriptional regulator
VNALHTAIAERPFGLLIAPTVPASAAHIPFVVHRGEGPFGTLYAHTARADPIAAALDGTTELLAVFQGPSAYIRSRWYANPGLPTYNFIAVHVYGRATPLSERDAVLAHLAELVHAHEASYRDEFRIAEVGADYVRPLLEHIAPFSLRIERIEGKVKLSQNRAAGDRAAVIRALRERGGDDDHAVASAMARHAYHSDEAQPLIVSSDQTSRHPEPQRSDTSISSRARSASAGEDDHDN